jgi:hypothetical protein
LQFPETAIQNWMETENFAHDKPIKLVNSSKVVSTDRRDNVNIVNEANSNQITVTNTINQLNTENRVNQSEINISNQRNEASKVHSLNENFNNKYANLIIIYLQFKEFK